MTLVTRRESGAATASRIACELIPSHPAAVKGRLPVLCPRRYYGTEPEQASHAWPRLPSGAGL
jgi:hypothetical protein